MGKETSFTFETVAGRSRLVSVVGEPTASCLGTAKSIGYTPDVGEPEGYVYERVERNGSRTVYTRNTRGLVLTKTEDADGVNLRVTSYTWEPDLRLPLTRTTSQMVETFAYSPSGQLATYSQTDALVGSPDFGKTRTSVYTYSTLASGMRVLSSIDGPGLSIDGVIDITTNEYDALGNLVKITDANSLATEFLQLNAAGQPTLVLGQDGNEWGFTYDIEGRIISSVQDPSGNAQTSTYVYDIIGQLISYTNVLGDSWTFTFDEARRLVKSTNSNGDEVNYSHDLMGNVIKVEYSDGANATTFFQETGFDELGRILVSNGAEGQDWAFTHDVEDNLALVTDPLLNETTNTFDPLNRLVSVLNRATKVTDMEYNDDGLLTNYTDPRLIETGFEYNGFGELLAETSADRGTLHYTYNNRGLVSSMTDGRGVVSTYEYDHGGRLVAHRFAATPSEDQIFEYDVELYSGNNTNGAGKIGRVTDPSGWTRTRYSNDGTVNQTRRNIEGVGYDVDYNYNLEGQLLWMEYPSGRRVNNTFNDNGDLTRVRTRMYVIDPATGTYPPKVPVVSSITYEPNGPLRRMVYGDNFIHRNYYDLSYRLTRINDHLSGVKLRDMHYSWTTRDNISTITDTLDGAQSLQFDYNTRELLTNAAGPWGDLQYKYNSVGNRTDLLRTTPDLTVTTDDYRYGPARNRLNRIIEAGGFERTFTHDAAGNVTYDNRSGGGYGYTYNAAGRMDSFSINGVVQAEYVYNALGQQVVRRLTQIGQTIHVLHDLDGNRIAEYDFDELAGTSALIREYVWLNGQPIAVIEGGATYYIRTDHIGRPVFATDGTGVKVWEATYLPFGGVHTSSGTTINLRFPGQWFQSESGLHQNWMRDYDPTTGRYIQADPLGLVDGASVYGYALQNPGRYTDPRGEDACYTDSKTGKQVCVPSSDTYCPSGNCSVYGERHINPDYTSCMMECSIPFSDASFCEGLASLLPSKILGKITIGSICLKIAHSRTCDERCIACGRE